MAQQDGAEAQMQVKSIRQNAVLNVIKTLTSLTFPLITYSYAARILLPEGMGHFNFASSVVSYFSLLAGLGVATYAVREGAKIRDQEEKIREFSSSVFSINMYATLIAYLLLAVSLLCIPKLQVYRTTILILSLQIVLTTVSAYWICSIFEEYTVQTVLTIGAQALALILMFLFVHAPENLNVYALITVLAYSGSGLVLVFFARRYVRFRFMLRPDLAHLKRILIIFSTAIAATIYISSDITILGWISGDRYTGLYGASANIYKIVKQLLNAIVAVVVPRFAYYLGTEQTDRLKDLGNSLMNYMITICLPAMVGLLFMSEPIIVAFVGEKFIDAADSLSLLSVALVFAVFANFFANCILLAYGKELIVMKATILSAVINFALNLIFIPYLHETGAAITTIIAEAVMCVIVWYQSRKLLKIQTDAKIIPAVTAGCAAIAAVCLGVRFFMQSTEMKLLIGIPVSIVLYGIIQMGMKNTVVVELLQSRKKR